MNDIMIKSSVQVGIEAERNITKTKLSYLKDTNLVSSVATIIASGQGLRGTYFILNETIFYPKGGGQPCDLGTLVFADKVQYPVTYVEFQGATGCVHHYISLPDNETEYIVNQRVGSSVELYVDAKRRLANARAHTGGHLLSDVVCSLASELTGKIGSHDPSEGCYVKFQGILNSCTPVELLESVNARLEQVLGGDTARSVAHWEEEQQQREAGEGEGTPLAAGKTCRFVQIEGFSPSPCGGTHVQSLGDLVGLHCTKVGIIKKEGVTKVSYAVQ